MTKSQKNALDVFRGSVDGWCAEMGYEIKEWTVCDLGPCLSVVAETGCLNDEGTAAEVYARDRAQIFIGRRGAMYFLKPGKSSPRKVQYPFFLSVACEQTLGFEEQYRAWAKRKEEKS